MVFPKEIKDLPFEEFESNDYIDKYRLHIYRKNINHEKMFVVDVCPNRNVLLKKKGTYRILISKKQKDFSVYRYGAVRCGMINPRSIFYRYAYCVMEECDITELSRLTNCRGRVYFSNLFDLLTEYYEKKHHERQKQAGYIPDGTAYECPTELPAGLIDYIQNNIIANDRTLIYKKGNIRGRCSACGRQVNAYWHNDRFKQHRVMSCPNCGEQVVCILENSNTWRADFVENVIALQRGKAGDVWFRQWHVIRNNDGIYTDPKKYLQEIGRYLIRGNKAAMWTSVLKENTFMSRSIEYSVDGWYRHKKFAVYDGSYKFFNNDTDKAVIGTSLQYAMLEDYLQNENIKSPDVVKYAMCFARYPVFEFLYKSGYYGIIQDKVRGYGNGKARDAISWQKKKLKDCFKIPLHYLKFTDPSELSLNNIYYMNKMYAENFAEQEIKCVCKGSLSVDTMIFLKKYVSIIKLLNYASKQQTETDDTIPGIIGIYKDYINDCINLKLDLTSKSTLFPKNIVDAHNNMIIEKKSKENEKYIEGMKKAEKRMKKFIFKKDNLIIRPAKSPGELILEGNTLHHCVGGYARMVAAGETTIFFVREADKPDKPFYTLEYRDKHVSQCRTYNNKSYETDEHVKLFVNEWYQNIIKGA